MISADIALSFAVDAVNARSLNALILRMWLGELDQNALSVMLGADFAVSGDWLLLALSATGGLTFLPFVARTYLIKNADFMRSCGVGGQNAWTHVVRAFVLKLLQKGDLHMAVLCLLAIGDKSDAVEVYVNHKRFL